MIKIIALLTMFIDHLGQIFFPKYYIFNLIGRLAFPLFAWGIANGYRKTKNFKSYAFRLFLLAVVSQYPYYLLFKNEFTNVCFTLLFGLFVLKLYDSKLDWKLKYPYISLLFLTAHILNFEYGIYGIACIAIFYIFKKKHHLVLLQLIITIFGIYFYDYYPIQIISILSSVIVICFEKYDFKLNKYFQYSFYPLHLIILYLLSNCLIFK